MVEPENNPSPKRMTFPIPWSRVITFVVIIGLALGAAFFPASGLTEGQRIMLAIFVGAAGLWMTEAIPPFATAILVIVLQVYVLGRPDGPIADGSITLYQIFINPVASPVLVLFFGGFILALAATKHGLDIRLAKAFLQPFGKRPAIILLGIILVTAVFSMFMSNTATTAMMIAILTPFYRNARSDAKFTTALILAVPFAANIGGVGTIIASPPNAVAASILSSLGHPISFLQWMSVGVPIAAIMLLVLWVILLLRYPPDVKEMGITFAEPLAIGPRVIIVTGTFAITVLLWMTEALHAIPAAVAALLPVAVFASTGVITAQDLKRLDWDVLILVAGGLSLGVGMENTGLSNVMVQLFPMGDLPFIPLLLGVGVVTIIVTNFMSNTSAANVFIPVAVILTIWSPTVGAITMALFTSFGISLPVSTPPNAIAYATGRIQTRDLAITGAIISMVAVVVITAAATILQNFTDW